MDLCALGWNELIMNFLTISRERITKVLTMHVCKRLVLIWLLMVLCDARIIGRTRIKDGSNNRQNSHEGNPRRCNRSDQQAVCDTPASRYPEQDSFLAMITNEAICDHFEASVTHKKIHFHPSVDGCSKALKWLEEEFDPSSTFLYSNTTIYKKIICNKKECENETVSNLCASNGNKTRNFSNSCDKCAVGCRRIVTGRTRYVTVKKKACNSKPAVNGGWTDWSNWGQCSVTCGGGNQTRTRNCTNPKPKRGGDACVGNVFEERTCNEFSCPRVQPVEPSQVRAHCIITGHGNFSCACSVIDKMDTYFPRLPKWQESSILGDDFATSSRIVQES